MIKAKVFMKEYPRFAFNHVNVFSLSSINCGLVSFNCAVKHFPSESRM